MTHFALVVEWQLPDDAEPHAEAALQAVLDKIRPALHDIRTIPNVLDRVTAYTGVSAELIAQAARAGALLPQAERLQLQPDDVVTVTLGPEHGDLLVDEATKALQDLFPGHRCVVLSHGATLTAGQEDAT